MRTILWKCYFSIKSWPFSAQTLQWLTGQPHPSLPPPPCTGPPLYPHLLPLPYGLPSSHRHLLLFPQRVKGPASRPLNRLLTGTSPLPDTCLALFPPPSNLVSKVTFLKKKKKVTFLNEACLQSHLNHFQSSILLPLECELLERWPM